MIASKCSVCGRETTQFPPWDKHQWACRPCWNGYVSFRRAFKAEHGVFPTIEEFRSDEDVELSPNRVRSAVGAASQSASNG